MPPSPIVDAHHHFIPPAILDDLERYLPPELSVKRVDGRIDVYRDRVRQMTLRAEHTADIERQLADMDAAGIQTSVLSAAVFQESMTMNAARVFNREMGAVVERYPDRFVGLAHVPPYGEAGIVEEVERAVREYGLKGVCITTSYRGRYPDALEYWPLYAKAAELNVPVFVHAAACPVDMPTLDEYALGNTLGRGLDHALVTARILYAGVIQEFPDLRFLMGHLGGAFYGMVTRLLSEAPARPNNGIPARDYPHQLRRIWFDTAPAFWQGPPEVHHAIATLGLDRICFGSDYPAGPSADILTDGLRIIDGLDLPPAASARICSLNASELFCL